MRVLSSIFIYFIITIMSSFASGLQKMMPTVKLFGRQVFVKRDDVLFKYKEGLSGNKGRKFQSLLSSGKPYGHLLSYGGYQSNTLLALSRIAAVKKTKLYYFTQPIPAHLKDISIGNYLQATLLGTEVIEVTKDAYNRIKNWSEAGANMNNFKTVFNSIIPESLEAEAVDWIPQGGCMPAAEEGVTGLAKELHEFIAASDLQGPWKIVVASGTGTTAYFLSRYFAQHNKLEDVQVVAVPCVGTSQHLAAQMAVLDLACGSSGTFPNIRPTDTSPKRTFAKPMQEHLQIWKSLQRQSGIEFDLVYAPRAFELLMCSASAKPFTVRAIQEDEPLLSSLFPGANIIYYHCGGVEGNQSQLSRYDYMGLS